MVAGLLSLLAAPAAAWIGERLPAVQILFANAALALLIVQAAILQTAGLLARCRKSTCAGLPRLPAPKGILLGLAALAASTVLFGTTWGTTWLDLVPTGRRIELGLVLFLVLFPASWALAAGLQHLVGSTGSSRWQWIAPLPGWIGTVLALWLGCAWFVQPKAPQFLIPATFVVVSGLLAIPLWTLPNRPGLSLARAIHHAGLTAWLLACHLPFVQAG